MNQSKKYINAGLAAARTLLLFFLFIYSIGFLTASLSYDAAASLADRGLFEPFDAQGMPFVWINVSIWVFALAVAVLSFFLYRRFLRSLESNPFRNTYRVVFILILFAICAVANDAAWVSVGKLNLSERRLEKIVALYGPKEDLCQVLKLGMTKDELLAIMGPPAGKTTIAECTADEMCPQTYCSQSSVCRSVTLNKEQKIIKIECWTGKAIGLPISD